jgi:hypothetical protein
VVQLLSNPSHPAAKLITTWDGRSTKGFASNGGGFQPKQAQHRLRPEAIADLLSQYQAGAHIEELAAKFEFIARLL